MLPVLKLVVVRKSSQSIHVIQVFIFCYSEKCIHLNTRDNDTSSSSLVQSGMLRLGTRGHKAKRSNIMVQMRSQNKRLPTLKKGEDIVPLESRVFFHLQIWMIQNWGAHE
ncbi:hypothetical protein ACET3Z_031063 [Daucus carota]